MRDFTSQAYAKLVASLASTFTVVPFADFLDRAGSGRFACLRHDVDRYPRNAVDCALIAREIGVFGSFYFRYPATFSKDVALRVAGLGHEVGYHYETMSKANGHLGDAVALFARELEMIRRVVPVRTVCMHGSPLSRWDNRAIWRVATLEQFQLLGEPYLSIDFSEVGYFTDTGRGWNKRSVAMRDATSSNMPSFASTWTLAAAIQRGELPDRVMITVHPERWNDRLIPWSRELVGQATKNIAKRVLRRVRSPAAP